MILPTTSNLRWHFPLNEPQSQNLSSCKFNPASADGLTTQSNELTEQSPEHERGQVFMLVDTTESAQDGELMVIFWMVRNNVFRVVTLVRHLT